MSRPQVTAGTVPAFDQMKVTVLPGADVVARLPGVLVVARVSPTPEGDATLTAVMACLESASQARGGAPGGQVSRVLRDLLGPDAPITLALVSATEDRLALVLAGSGTAAVPDRGWRLACDGSELLCREVDWPAHPLVLGLDMDGPDAGGPEQPPPSAAGGARPFDLRAGVVPGGGAALHPPPRTVSPTGTLHVRSGLRPPPPPPVAGTGVRARPAAPRRIELISGTRPAGAPRTALPIDVSGTAAGESGGQDGSRARVLGYRCRDGHLNDPRVLFCALCGIRMAESTGVFAEGPRPSLGLLIFDNGASFALDEDYLLGREPEVDERVRSGRLRPLVLFDTTGVVSRRHAEIRLKDWDVLLLDSGSANGTLIADRGMQLWSALVPGQPIRMTPGMQVRIGERTFVFESSLLAP